MPPISTQTGIIGTPFNESNLDFLIITGNILIKVMVVLIKVMVVLIKVMVVLLDIGID